MCVGERIKARRKELGMSAEELAERVGKAPATIYRYEKGEIRNVDSRILLPIADALMCTPAYLMGWEDAPVPSAPLDPAAAELLQIYESLNPEGQSILMGTARGLSANPAMRKDGESQSGTA